MVATVRAGAKDCGVATTAEPGKRVGGVRRGQGRHVSGYGDGSIRATVEAREERFDQCRGEPALLLDDRRPGRPDDVYDTGDI